MKKFTCYKYRYTFLITKRNLKKMILKGTFPTEKFKSLATPFYFYDITLLKETLNTVKTEAGKYGYHVHYAVKAW